MHASNVTPTISGQAAATARSPRLQKAAAVAGAGVLLVYFAVTLLPIWTKLAGLHLTPLRVFLLVMFLPLMAKLLSGRAGRVTAIDWLMMAHAFWIVLALLVVHGPSKLPFAGITTVELVGGYFLGRVLIRSPQAYYRMLMLLFGSLVILLPFALIESQTGVPVVPKLLGKVFNTLSQFESIEGRMGLERVYAVFEHPILYGLFCSLGIANAFYSFRGGLVKRAVVMMFATGMTFMALSSAPLIAVGIQMLLIGWDRATKGKWIVLIVLFTLFYVTIDALSNRTPVTIMIETLTFNAGTGWTRIAIFDYGFAAVKGSPIFGIGFNDWARPGWLTSSVDNFWLVQMMRYGFVGAGFLFAAIIFHLLAITRTKITQAEAQQMRIGYCIALVGTCFTLTTVHVWGPVGVFVTFYLGAGGWFYTNTDIQGDPAEDAPPEEVVPTSRYTRFPPKERIKNRPTHGPTHGKPAYA